MKSSCAIVFFFSLIAASQAGYIGNIFSSVSGHMKGTAQQFAEQTKQTGAMIQGHIKEGINKAVTGDILGTAQTISNNAFETSKNIADSYIDLAQKITSDTLDDAKVMLPPLGRPIFPGPKPAAASETESAPDT